MQEFPAESTAPTVDPIAHAELRDTSPRQEPPAEEHHDEAAALAAEPAEQVSIFAPRPATFLGAADSIEPPPSSGRWKVVAAIAAGLFIGLIATLLWFARRADTPPAPLQTTADAGKDQGAAAGDTDVAVTPPPAAEGATPETAKPEQPAAPAQTAQATPPPPDPVPAPARPEAATRRVAAENGRLVIRSVPSGAMLTVDGELAGQTPATIRSLSYGTHTVQIARPGYAPRVETVTLSRSQPEQTLSVELELGTDRPGQLPSTPPPDPRPQMRPNPQTPPPPTRATTGSIFLDSRPRGARVWIDGTLIGTTPFRIPAQTVGLHTIRFDLDGYRPVSAPIDVKAGEESRLAVTLERIGFLLPGPRR
jgi:hypothetical protein